MRKLTLTVGSALGVALTGSLVALTPQTGYAQALEEITVTARKTSESLQEVPMSVTAITSDDIERLNLQDLSDISQQDTSVQFDEGFTPSDTRITIRGLSPTRGRPNAATLIDGIDVTSEAVSNAGGSTLINPRLIDVERIEIVKGPQSALFGRSAFAGAIQYVTKDPTDTTTGNIFVNANTENDREVRGSLSIPITDTLGVLMNGYAWDSDGSYKNSATDSDIGGGSGQGGSITFKWEPTDSVGIKWRTEYSDDEFDVAPQALLNDLNTELDLATVTPNALDCNLTNGLVGPLDSGGPNLYPQNLPANCQAPVGMKYASFENGGYVPQLVISETQALNQFFADQYGANPDGSDEVQGSNGGGLGQYDPALSQYANQYNKNVVSFFQGTIPDGDTLQAALSPNYRTGPGATNPAQARDFDGTDRQVFRTSVKVDWAITDTLDFVSNTGYVDSNVDIQTDIGKYYVDEGRPDVAALYLQPSPYFGAKPQLDSYAAELLNIGITDLSKYAPINTNLAPDGINDAPTQFIQDDTTDTDQFSQEFRLAWQATDTINFTTGLQYWQERVDVWDLNSAAIAGGAICNIIDQGEGFFDSSNGNTGQASTGFVDQCGNTNLAVAGFMGDLYQGRVEQPSYTGRETDHYSWYGSTDLNLTDKFTARFEARFTKEDNQVTGSIQTPCVSGALPWSYYKGQGYTEDEIQAQFPDSCNNNPANAATDISIANGGQATGPSNVILCGQTGRCDRVGLADGALNVLGNNGAPKYAGNNLPVNQGYNGIGPVFDGPSWWAFGFRPEPGVEETLKRTDRFWAPKATVEYAWNEDVMTYFSWSRGIKPGGFSLLTTGAFGLDANLDADYDEIEFEEERLDVWELGAKTTLFDGRVRLNGAAYFQDFKDKQVTVQKVTAGTTGTEVENISGSEVRGIELDATWQINENWLASGGYTFLDSEYTDYTITTKSSGDISRINAGKPSETCSELAVLEGGDPDDVGCVMSFNGNELERAPKNALLANLNYTNNLFDTGMEWYGEANYRYQDERYMEAFNIVKFDAYSLTDLRFGIMADVWDLQFYLTNVFDDDTVISGGPNPGIPTGSFGFGFSLPPQIGQGGPGINAGPRLPSDIYANLPNPRVFGVTAKFRFGE
jgi:outer membrane receptor protein involved in Fe transport